MGKRKSIISQNPNILLNENAICDNQTRLFLHYKLMACNRFKWENLPTGLESRHIEDFLFENGQCFFFKDNKLGLMCLPCHGLGDLNIYGDNIKLSIVSRNGKYQKILEDGKDGIKIRANDLCLPTEHFIRHYAQKMDDIETVIKRNLKQQMKPFFVTSTDTNLLTVKNIVNDVDNGKEVVILDKDLGEQGFDGFKMLQTGVIYLVDKLEDERKSVESELLSFLGLDNANTEKRERLLVDEVNANNEYIETNLDMEYKTRLLACKMINEKFGTNIKVTKVVDSFGGDENGEVHTRVEDIGE